MADEINRASSAHAIGAAAGDAGETRVAVSGVDHPLPAPFHVLATQNPIEQEGTYPLPEAQLDRFLLSVEIGYPTEADERAMLLATTGASTAEAQPVMDTAGLVRAQALVRAIPVGERVVDAVLALVRGGAAGNARPRI